VQREKGDARLGVGLDQQINVALRSGLAARHRAEQAEPGNSPRLQPRRVLAQDTQHPLALGKPNRSDRPGFGTHDQRRTTRRRFA